MARNRRRAEPLSADERRHSIITAVIPLLVQRGAPVTTREMAEAAGIAEGTIFRVFPDKAALIYETVKYSMDPEPVQRALSEIYPEAPLAVQLEEAARILLEHLETVIALVTILRTMPEHAHSGPPRQRPDFVEKANQAINQSVTELFERHRDRLGIGPSRAAAAFRSLIFAAGHPAIAGREKLTIPEIVSVLTTGIMEPVEAAI